MLYSSNPKSSSSTLRPPTASTPPYVDNTNQLLTDGEDLAGFPLSYQDQPNFSARSSFSASTCSFDFQTNEFSIDPLHTQEQRRRQPDLVLEQENHARIRMMSISHADDLQNPLALEFEELPTRPMAVHRSNLSNNEQDQEEAEIMDVRHIRERERSMAPSPESIRFSGESEKARRLSIRKVFIKKTSSIGTTKDMGDTLSLSEKRTTNNSSRGSTLTSGTAFSKDVPIPVVKQDYIDELPCIRDVETCKIASDVDEDGVSVNGNCNGDMPVYVEYAYPDGGLKAWLQVVGAFFILFNSWGLVVAYGVFQEYYTSLPGGPLSSSSAISLIGSIQSFLVLFVGFFAGRLLDAGYFRYITIAGTALMVLGLFAAGWCGLVYYRILLCQGIITGIGMGLLFTPSVAIVSSYFQKRRALAGGIVAAGSSLGGVVFPIIVRELLPAIGFRYTLTILSSIVLLTLIISNVLLSPRTDVPHRKSGQWLQLSAFREPTYCFYVVGLFCAFLGLYMPFFYVEEWAVGKGFDGKYGGFRMYYLVSIMNASSIFGRIVPNIFADFLGPINTQLPSIFISGVLILCWQSITTFPSLVIFVVLYGFFSGCLVSLPPASVASLSPDLSFLGVRMGMMFSIASIGSLSGAPIAGAIIGHQNGHMQGAMIWSGGIMLVSVLLVGLARYSRGKEKGGGWKLKI